MATQTESAAQVQSTSTARIRKPCACCGVSLYLHTIAQMLACCAAWPVAA